MSLLCWTCIDFCCRAALKYNYIYSIYIISADRSDLEYKLNMMHPDYIQILCYFTYLNV